MILYQLLTKYLHADHKARLDEVLELINGNHQKNYPLSDLASVAKLSLSRFRTVFKQYTGYTPIQYQNYVKMTHAYDLLINGHCSVGEAASMVGFDNCYYFSRMFKKIIGTPPSKI